MRIYFLLFLCLLPGTILAQVSTDSLIDHSLNMVDYPSYEPAGQPTPMMPRLGIYMRDIPADSVRKLTHGRDSIKGSPIWHVAPHWSADESGLMLGDIVLRVDGRTLADSVYGPDDILNTRVREKKPGDIINFQIIRDGAVREIPVKLLTGKRSKMEYSKPPQLGPIRNSWLQKTIKEKGLNSWADTIAKQIASIADMDFCDKPFTDRPSPFRLNAVTYLDHYPLRVGALSRLIDQSVWNELEHPQGIICAIDAAAVQLGVPMPETVPALPGNVETLNQYFAEAQSFLDRAYA
ncbi:MAG: PDZ domain-containing protein, partial [Bacteroidota bacterium]|nr:PDZ domain-containing protein [Bacteroidota bacterium]